MVRTILKGEIIQFKIELNFFSSIITYEKSTVIMEKVSYLKF